MDEFLGILGMVWRIILFVLLSILFLPSFFVVTYFQETWSKMLGELFNIK